MMCIRRGVPISPGNRLADAGEVGVEAPVEANLQLHACGLHRGQRAIDLARLKAMGFSQKMCLPALAALHDQIGVRVGGGADEHRIDGGVGEDLVADSATVGMPQCAASACAASRFDVGDGQMLASGRRNASVSACTRPMRPAPMIPK